MEIINNRTQNNHNEIIIQYFKSSDEAIIVSPFLSKSFEFFEFKKIKHLKKLTLITTLKNDYNEQLCKINFFKKILEFGRTESIEIVILIDNSLHGKIYVFKKDDKYLKAIISSANFTLNGLKLNNEWGVSFEDSDKIEEITLDLLSNIVLEPVNIYNLNKIKDKFNKLQKPIHITNNTINLVGFLNIKSNPLNLSTKTNYFLKPIGSSGNLISVDSKFNIPLEQLHFSKYPRSLKLGDILITYAVGYKKVLSIFKIISETKNTNIEGDRWPYFVMGENLTRYYGNEWNNYNIHITTEKNIFIDNTKMNATPSGKNSYGSLQQGSDKLEITREFGDYLINKIVDINKEIKFRENSH
jgi:hypothetical protein